MVTVVTRTRHNGTLYIHSVLFTFNERLHQTTDTFPMARSQFDNFCYWSSLNSQQVLKMSSTLINARMDTSYHGMSRPFNGPGAVANGLTRIRCASVKCLFIFRLHLNIPEVLSAPKIKMWTTDVTSRFWEATVATSVCVTKQTHYNWRIITDRTRSKIRISHGKGQHENDWRPKVEYFFSRCIKKRAFSANALNSRPLATKCLKTAWLFYTNL